VIRANDSPESLAVLGREVRTALDAALPWLWSMLGDEGLRDAWLHQPVGGVVPGRPAVCDW
jgi:hypothetical protein